jgi:hypothetical protein
VHRILVKRREEKNEKEEDEPFDALQSQGLPQNDGGRDHREGELAACLSGGPPGEHRVGLARLS